MKMYDAVCCRMLQGVAGCCRVLQGVAGCCRVLQGVAVCCNVLQCAAMGCNVSRRINHQIHVTCIRRGWKGSISASCLWTCMLQYAAMCCSMLHFVAVCCREWTFKITSQCQWRCMLQYVAVRCREKRFKVTSHINGRGWEVSIPASCQLSLVTRQRFANLFFLFSYLQIPLWFFSTRYSTSIVPCPKKNLSNAFKCYILKRHVIIFCRWNKVRWKGCASVFVKGKGARLCW